MNQKGYIMVLTLLMLVALTVAGLGAMLIASSDVRQAGIQMFNQTTIQAGITGTNVLSGVLNSYSVQPFQYSANQVRQELGNGYGWYKGNYTNSYTNPDLNQISSTTVGSVSGKALIAGQDITNEFAGGSKNSVNSALVIGFGPTGEEMGVERGFYYGK